MYHQYGLNKNILSTINPRQNSAKCCNAHVIPKNSPVNSGVVLVAVLLNDTDNGGGDWGWVCDGHWGTGKVTFGMRTKCLTIPRFMTFTVTVTYG